MGDRLSKHRDVVENIFHKNMQAIVRDGRWSAEENAGTAMIAAVAAMSYAAFMVASVDPRMQNAPMEAQIDDFLGLVREVMVRKAKPFISLAVDNATPSALSQEGGK